MPGITNDSREQLNNEQSIEKEEIFESNSTTSGNIDEEISTISNSQETMASKAIKEARERITKEIKDNLKQKVDKVENKDIAEKKIEKEETVIQKIKNFINKIIEMQEAELDAEAKLNDLEENSNSEKNQKTDKTPEIKPKYMLEYYDLPYRYNETVVKILAQTPKRLFVYWDISDDDKKRLENAFGENFFYDTYPVLLVHNEDKNYTFEVPINDFANSWYLDINDPKSKYVIQLGRKFKSKPEFINITSVQTNSIELQNDYIPITTSNVLEVPNDHILFDRLEEKVLYKNVKTNEESYVDIANSKFISKIGKIYNIYDLYKEIYKNEIGDGTLTDLLNPSSMSSSGINSSIYR